MARMGWGDVGAGGAVAVVERDAAGVGADAVGLEVGAGVDGEDALEGAGGAGVDGADAGGGVGAAEDDGVGFARQRDVIGVATLAEEEAGVFHAADGLGETELRHRQVSSGWAAGRMCGRGMKGQ